LVRIFRYTTSGDRWRYVPGRMASFCHLYSSDSNLLYISSKSSSQWFFCARINLSW
jgi:hypothetical protein